MDIISLYNKFIECKQMVSTDTRIIEPGSLFFAWKGEHRDGNTYAQEALDKGARYVVIDNPNYFIDHRTIVVGDSIKIFQDLARHHRRQFDVPVVAIAGSNGKTTTKELIARILATQKNIVASIGSLNNHIGVPKTLLRITRETDIVIVEMGANHAGEIKSLCHIAQPTHGLVTNIGRDHIGSFGDQTAIIESNVELYDYLRVHGGNILINKNNMTLMKFAEGIMQTCYGENLESEFGVKSQNTSPFISCIWKGKHIETQLTGEYNIENIVAAIAVGKYFNIIDEHICSAISSYKPTNNRSEILVTEKGNIIIKDFYNANLTSMKFALENLRDISKENPNKKSIAIMGDMLDLGEYSLGEHQSALAYAHNTGINEIILIGSEFQKIDYDPSNSYIDVDAAIFALQKSPIKDSVILLKASNGTNFQKLFDNVEW